MINFRNATAPIFVRKEKEEGNAWITGKQEAAEETKKCIPNFELSA
jgi:hypothetical protein